MTSCCCAPRSRRLTTAARECRLWLEDGLDLVVSVNLSAHDLLDKDLPWFVLDVLRNHDLAPRYLVAEVTEEGLVRDFDHATQVLQRLRDIGIRVSVDDFGAAIELAHDLGLEFVAEGVETRPALQRLRERGCERAQGFLISPPLPADSFVDWVRQYADGVTLRTPALQAG